MYVRKSELGHENMVQWCPNHRRGWVRGGFLSVHCFQYDTPPSKNTVTAFVCAFFPRAPRPPYARDTRLSHRCHTPVTPLSQMSHLASEFLLFTPPSHFRKEQ